MKKLLLLLTLSTPLMAEPVTKLPEFISKGGFHGLCKELDSTLWPHDWGMIVDKRGNLITYACLSRIYQRNNPDIKFVKEDG